MTEVREAAVEVLAPGVTLGGTLAIPERARGVVLFAHGSGSGRHSPRNRYVAHALQQAGLGTLLVDLLTAAEERAEATTRHLRFDIELLAERLEGATRWLAVDPRASDLRIGYFGASTGAAAALVAAARMPARVGAIVSRGGRPDLASTYLPGVRAPTLLIVGGADVAVLQVNRRAFALLETEKRLEIIRGAGHLFEEPGALDQVARLAAGWLTDHLEPTHRLDRPEAS
jgi:putative phosphoribosyl transferase